MLLHSFEIARRTWPALLLGAATLFGGLAAQADDRRKPLPCWKTATTQAASNACAAADAKAAELELKRTLARLRKAHAGDELFLAKLEAAQTAWLAYRDAELAARFPEPAAEYGSAHPMCRQLELTALIRERITTLRQWLSGDREGDVCAGSRQP